MLKLTLKEYLDGKGVTRYELSKRTGIKFQIIDNYYKNKVVRYDSYVLGKICDALDCEISDILTYTKH
ncbi:MAG: helix-turn-helix transcriptional regulator [Ruminococcaceae bacterium]|nr:helix-turn-helix transcriptional regulator [Oscillospiraceae bacterium]